MIRVLVVDDEWDICMMVSSHLQKHHFEPEYALSVKEALSKMDTSNYQLLFIDIDLTDGSGLDVIKYLQKSRSIIKIVVISAYHNEAGKALEVGANLFITKPFSSKIIDQALRTLNFLSL